MKKSIKEVNAEKKRLAIIESEKNQREVSEITITITWKKSRTWGYNPHAIADVKYKYPQGEYGGTFERKQGYTCSGCGYDKKSTVIADIFNDFLKYKLYRRVKKISSRWQGDEKIPCVPYGIAIGKVKAWIDKEGQKHPSYKYHNYEGGIGAECYYDIAKAIGGKFEQISSGESFDVFRYTDRSRKVKKI